MPPWADYTDPMSIRLYLLFALLILWIIVQDRQLRRYRPRTFCPRCGAVLPRWRRCRQCGFP